MKTLSLLAAAALSVSLTVSLPVSLFAASAGHAAPPRPTPPTTPPTPTTQLTIEVASCDRCAITLGSYLEGSMDGWTSKTKKAGDGSVTFAVRTDRTVGLSIMVRAPWEGATGYVTNAVFRYRGAQPGDRVGFTRARAATRGSGCWAGTTADAVTLRLKVRKVRVDGHGGEVPGSIAWLPVTQDWLGPMVPTWHGVVGTQDVMPCKAP